MTDEQRARFERLEREELTAEEFAALLSIPVGADEVAEVVALVAWLSRRYPTARERFAYIRRARTRWTRPLVSGDDERA